MAQMSRLLAFLLVWQSNCESLFVCSEPAIQGVLQQFNFWGNCLFWFVAVVVVVLLAVVLGFAHGAIASIGIAKVFFFLFVLLFLVAVLGHVFRRP